MPEVTMENYTFQVIDLPNGKSVIKLFDNGSFKGFYGPLDATQEKDTITSRLISSQEDAQPFNTRNDAITYATEVLNLVEQK